MNRILLAFSALVWVSASYLIQDINYRPRLLLKVLKKYDVPGFEALQPLPVPHYGPTPGKYFEIRTPESEVRYVYVGRVNSCRTGGCNEPDKPIDPGQLESEFFDYFLLFDETVHVRAIRVYNYEASYGYEITAPGWLRQFLGYDGTRELIVGKDVDAITGATVSVYAITADVETRTRQLQEWLEKNRQPTVDSSAADGEEKVH